MTVREAKRFPEKAFAVSAQYDTEFSTALVEEVGFTYDGTLAAGGAVVPVDDAPFKQLGVLEVNQLQRPIIRMQGRSWRHLSAYLWGGYSKRMAATANGNAFYATASLPLGRIVPGMMINAKIDKAFVRGQFGVLTDYGPANVTGLASTLRPTVKANPGSTPAQFFAPDISEQSEDIGTVGLITANKRFDRDLIVPGIMLTQLDASANSRVDGIVRRLRIELVNQDGGKREIKSLTWGQAREEHVRAAGFSEADWDSSTGVAMVRLEDPERRGTGGSLMVRQGDSLSIEFDTAATVEAHFTAVAAAAGDTCLVTVIAAEARLANNRPVPELPINQTAPNGLTAQAQQRLTAAGRVSLGRRRLARLNAAQTLT
jgi:hypothetical protein